MPAIIELNFNEEGVIDISTVTDQIITRQKLPQLPDGLEIECYDNQSTVIHFKDSFRFSEMRVRCGEDDTKSVGIYGNDELSIRAISIRGGLTTEIKPTASKTSITVTHLNKEQFFQEKYKSSKDQKKNSKEN